MTRKPITLILITLLLVVTMLASGCGILNRPATPPIDSGLSEDEGAATLQEAGDNSTATAEEGDVSEGAGVETPEGQSEPVATSTPEPTAEPTTEPTTEPTAEPTVEPTAEPTVEPTVESTEEPATETGETVVIPGKHVVQAGENLFRIALRYGLSVEAMAQANGITNPALVYPGQELTVPSSGSVVVDDGGPVVSGGDIVHTVQAGENLFRIALKYNYDQYYIARYNSISNPAMIYVGQQIHIPNN